MTKYTVILGLPFYVRSRDNEHFHWTGDADRPQDAVKLARDAACANYAVDSGDASGFTQIAVLADLNIHNS